MERTPEGDRVIGDDQHYTLSGPVQLRTDKPGLGDKKYLTAKWAESIFQIDPRTRRADIVRGLKMMTPNAAVTLVAQVKQSGEWKTQRCEEWQAVTISRVDPYKVLKIRPATVLLWTLNGDANMVQNYASGREEKYAGELSVAECLDPE